MPLHCLLLTRDDQVIRVLRRVVDDLDVSLEVCTGADKAAEELEQRKFDAVLIDCDDVHNAITVLCSVRLTPSNKTSTVFAIVNGITTPTSAIELGANLSLEKPINDTMAKHAFRTVHGLMLQERRRYYRHAVDLAVTLRFEDRDKATHRDVPATAVNLSEGGMALKVKSTLPSEFRTAQMRFILPGSHDLVEILGVIAWADEQGNVGVRFENVPYTLRDRLAKFFSNVEQKDRQAPPPKKSD
jgi:ActR/RegA family two-component response regulator